MKQTFTEKEIYNDLTDESGVRIVMKIEEREPTPLLDELQRRMFKPFIEKFEEEQIDIWLKEQKKKGNENK